MLPPNMEKHIRRWISSAPTENTLFVLFLSSILGYGIFFAFYLLTNFDLVNLVRDVNFDDSFYYFQIAKNFAEGKFSTFDHGITRTNGYHPLWMLLITPFYWLFDKEAALFGIKAFEIMLVAGAVVLVTLAARLARLLWVLLFAVLPTLYSNVTLIKGTEAAAALFMLGLLFFTLSLFAREPPRWKWPLAITVFFLPWVRLEYVAISITATAALCLLECLQRKESLATTPLNTLIASIRSLNSAIPFAGACVGILTYFAYNGTVFGGIVPVSGATKVLWSRWLQEENGYSFLQNFQDMLLSPHVGSSELLVALEASAYTFVVGWFVRRSRSREDYRLLSFLIGIFSLGIGHLAHFMYAVLLMHPQVLIYPSWYYVPAYLMMTLIVPVRCFVAVYFIRRFVAPQSSRVAGIASWAVVCGVGAIFISNNDELFQPYRFVDSRRDDLSLERHSWNMHALLGLQVMNDLLPERSIIGSGDAGVIGYFSRFPVVELGGLVNSYDYFHKAKGTPWNHVGLLESIYKDFGITHFSNFMRLEQNLGTLLYEGSPFNGGELAFKTAESPWTPPGEGDLPSRRFWKRMKPHFDYLSESDDIGAVVDGRLGQAFARNCTSDEMAVWSLGGKESAQISFFYTTQIGLCVSSILLPRNPVRPVRIHRTTRSDQFMELTEDGRMTLSPNFDIHRTQNSFIGIHPTAAAANYLQFDDRLYVGERFLGHFEEGFDDWRTEGDAVTNHRDHEYEQLPVSGNAGPGFLTTYHFDSRDSATGTARSPEFTGTDDQWLIFLIAGGMRDGVGVRLLADATEVKVWGGRDTEHFELIIHPLVDIAGKRLQLEIFDHETGSWGHVMLDHVLLVHPWKRRDEWNG